MEDTGFIGVEAQLFITFTRARAEAPSRYFSALLLIVQILFHNTCFMANRFVWSTVNWLTLNEGLSGEMEDALYG